MSEVVHISNQVIEIRLCFTVLLLCFLLDARNSGQRVASQQISPPEDGRQYLALLLPHITLLLESFELTFCMLRCDICGP